MQFNYDLEKSHHIVRKFVNSKIKPMKYNKLLEWGRDHLSIFLVLNLVWLYGQQVL